MTNKENNFENENKNVDLNNDSFNNMDENNNHIDETKEINIDETMIHEHSVSDSTEANSNATDDVKDDNKTADEFNSYKESTVKEVKKRKAEHKGGMRGKLASYIIVGLLCSSLGAGIASAISLNAMDKKINELKQENKKNPVQNSEFNTSTTSSGLSVPDIVKKVGPAVVGISVKSVQSYGNSPFVQQVEGIGSGVIINEDGYILTNNHVIQNATTINVILNNGDEVEAKVVNADPAYDLAIVKITKDMEMPGVVEFGDSENLAVGEPVVAIGNPLGKELLGSVTTGVVSALNRNIDDKNTDLKLIQTDAAISPGNSGGPLLNSHGQLIGINTEKRVGTGVEGLGFAIPIHQIQPKIEGLMKPKIMLGVTIRQVTEEDSKKYNIPEGLFINDIKPYSSAEKAGLKIGDVITSFNGKKVKTNDELNELKEKAKEGDKVPVEVDRDGKKVTIDLTLETGY